jgi:hypothetical protein
MFIELLAMLPGDEEPIDRWEIQLGATNPQQSFAPAWDQLSRKIVEQQDRSYHVQPEIFLCLREPEIGSNYGRLRELFDTAHGYIRGAPLYLVISSTIGQTGTLVEEKRTLNLWFETVERNVTDLIQFPLPHYQHRKPVPAGRLSQKGDESRHRQAFIKRLLHDETLSHSDSCQSSWPWRHISLPISIENNSLWSVYSASHESENFNRVFVVGPDGQSRTLLEGELAKTKARYSLPSKTQPKQIIVPWREELRPDFKQFCRAESLPIAPLFGGPCEIRFLLQRLNEHAAKHMSTDDPTRSVERRSENEVFAPYERKQAPSLLLTSAFHQHDEGHFSAVRKEISEIVRLAMQDSAMPITHNAINLDGLHQVLSSANMPHQLTVWLYLGHGKKGGGLREYNHSFRDAAEWLTCFSGLADKRSLALVFFSACHSTDIAQLFAKAGVGVAIGFENKVDQATCHQVSVPVIHAAWKTNGNREAILEAFRRTVAAPTLGVRQAKPLAFHG